MGKPDIETVQRKFDALTKIAAVMNGAKTIDPVLKKACNIICEAYSGSGEISVSIAFGDNVFRSRGFKTFRWTEKHEFTVSQGVQGAIEVFYSENPYGRTTHDSANTDDNFIQNIAALVSGQVSKVLFSELIRENKERVKEIDSIHRAAGILKSSRYFEDSLYEICQLLPEAMQYPEFAVSRIFFEDQVFISKKFRETIWSIKESFETKKLKKGTIEVFYLKEFPVEYEGPFLKEELLLIGTLASLISTSSSQDELESLIKKNAERLKELKGLNQTSLILKQSKSFDESLQIICSILPEAYQYPEFTVVRITYESQVFTSKKFIETAWCQKQYFETPGNRSTGLIEVFYLKEFPYAYEGPFLKEERELVKNIASLISGSAIKDVFDKLLHENCERLKELQLIDRTTRIISQSLPVKDTLMRILKLIPGSWQYPNETTARITYEGKVYQSRNFEESDWLLKENFNTIDNKKGTIEVFYLKEFPDEYEGPFLKEERNLIINLGKLVSGYLNNFIGREISNSSRFYKATIFKPEEYRKSLIKNKRPMQLFFNQQTIEKYIYLDMMKYKVKEILFVSSLYDAFTLENENSFFEQFMGIIYQYSLFSLPRITAVTTTDEALGLLETTDFDLLIIMAGMDKQTPVVLADKIRKERPDLLVFLLLNQNKHIQYFENLIPSIPSIDKLFVWNGDSQIFFAMVKSIEDHANVGNDTKIGLVRIILLIEDSAWYYSKYLPILYSIVFDQVQQVLPEVEKNELDKICRMRSRPKILHARSYEDALSIFEKYKEFILCVISDVEFERNGKPDKKAGIRLIKYLKSHIHHLPIVLQSSEKRNESIAKSLGVSFINKNSEKLLNDLKSFLTAYLGFGDFVFRDKDDNKIAVASTLREFEALIPTIPDESFYLQASENQYSLWFMARGEIELARMLNPLRISNVSEVSESRKFLIDSIRRYKEEKKKGKVLNFDEADDLNEKNIVAFSGGSFGGKGRSLSFITALVSKLDFPELRDRINIRTPITAIIGTDEFENFLDSNNLFDKVIDPSMPFSKLKDYFIEAQLSTALIKKLEFFVDQVEKPIAIRSSSISEDSLTQTFAGIFDTYIIPNIRKNKRMVLQNLINAIKLVYSSVFSDKSRAFYSAINHKVEEEKMAVVLQELVGMQHGDYYYPHLSGMAQSYNFYPVAHMKPEEGFAVLAFGLGSYVMQGWNSYRFSPKYPNIELYTTKDLLTSSQVKFYALDCSGCNFDYVNEGELASLVLLDISKAEEHETLKHCVSVYNIDNERIEPGLSNYGPRIMNFVDILKYNYIPLAEIIDKMLTTIEEAMGSPVEIEFAIDLNKTINNLPSFYLLQIKPLTGSQTSINIDFTGLDRSKMLLYTESSLGNGELNTIRDVVFVNTENFDKLRTQDMASEIEKLNAGLVKQNKKYILVGPGRWGTRNRYVGIPATWSQISNARVIVEISMANFPLDASLGSHFFHNITSMNIGYFSIQESSYTDFINWEILNSQKKVNSSRFFTHVQFRNPLNIYMDGRRKMSAIVYNS